MTALEPDGVFRLMGNSLTGQSFVSPEKVYFIEAIGFRRVKIGYTADLPRRFRALQAACPFQLRILGWVPGTTTYERKLHRHFADLRVRGEWFLLDKVLDDFIYDLTRRGRPCG